MDIEIGKYYLLQEKEDDFLIIKQGKWIIRIINIGINTATGILIDSNTQGQNGSEVYFFKPLSSQSTCDWCELAYEEVVAYRLEN